MCLCIVGAVVITGVIIWKQSDQQARQDDLELLRDRIKQYKPVEETDKPPENVPVITDPEDNTEPSDTETGEQTEPGPEGNGTEISDPSQEETPVESEPEPEPVKILDSLLDFPTMQEINPDIYAWIEIDDTTVDYPVLQSPTDDNKYLSKAFDVNYYVGGSLFTQATYNGTDFNDPVTVIYGHSMRRGTLFGQLEGKYSSKKGFDSHSTIKLYLPDEVRYYKVFAAVVYPQIHILDAYDFSDPYRYNQFFNGVKDIRDFKSQFNYDIFPEPGDRVIILSTCLLEDKYQRFLVMAILQDDIG